MGWAVNVLVRRTVACSPKTCIFRHVFGAPPVDQLVSWRASMALGLEIGDLVTDSEIGSLGP